MHRSALLLCLAAQASAFLPPVARQTKHTRVRAADDEPTSLGGAMFKQLFGGVQEAVELQGNTGNENRDVRSTDVAAAARPRRRSPASVTVINARSRATSPSRTSLNREDLQAVQRQGARDAGHAHGRPGRGDPEEI